MDNQEAKDVEEAIKHLEDILYVLRSNYQYRTSYAIELLINGYRTLEKHIGFYEKNGSYKARIFELQDKNTELEEQVEYLEHEVELRDATVEKLMREKEELKSLANNKQWISPCYVAENYISKEKVDNLLKELDYKCNSTLERTYKKEILQQLKEE